MTRLLQNSWRNMVRAACLAATACFLVCSRGRGERFGRFSRCRARRLRRCRGSRVISAPSSPDYASYAILADVALRGGSKALAIDVARKANGLFDRYGPTDAHLRHELAFSNVTALLAMAGK
jgi:hypothetical protein